MLNNFPQTVAVLKDMRPEAAAEWIEAARRHGEIDANEAFALAAECDVEFGLVPVDSRD